MQIILIFFLHSKRLRPLKLCDYSVYHHHVCGERGNCAAARPDASHHRAESFRLVAERRRPAQRVAQNGAGASTG